MLEEFKQFALRGNVLDMAVGIVIGVAFGAIVSSLVDDIIMPPLGLVLGGMDFSQLFVVLRGEGDFAGRNHGRAHAQARRLRLWRRGERGSRHEQAR